MTPNEPLPDAPPRPMRSPTASAAILLGIYITMYLAVGGLVQMIDPAAAKAVVQCIAD